MWLKELKLYDRGVIQQVEFSFQSQFSHSGYGLDFIVGVNGTGKSTVLRSIAELINLVVARQEPSYGYRLVLTGADTSTGEVILTNVDEAGNRVKQDVPDVALPMVIYFTAGSVPEDRAVTADESPAEALHLHAAERLQLEVSGHFLPNQGESKPTEQTGSEPGIGQVMTIETQHLPLVMLCGWLADLRRGQGALNAAFEGANVERICGFALRFMMDDESLAQNELICKLAAEASRRARNGLEYQLVFDLADKPDLASRLLQERGDALVMYQELLPLFQQGLAGPQGLTQVDLILERSPSAAQVPPVHLFRWLSDGEQSFLGRMALFPLVGDMEAIVLLDEPENHFNDAWKQEIVYYLHRSLRDSNSHVLIATHASITLTDVPRAHIHILQHDGCYTVGSQEPVIQTFGVDASDIVTQVFGAPRSTGRFSGEQIRRRLAIYNRLPPEKSEPHLLALSQEVGPGYWSYVVRQELDEGKRRKAEEAKRKQAELEEGKPELP